MNEPVLLHEVKDQIAFVRLNRPDRLNALISEDSREWAAAIGERREPRFKGR